MDLNRQPPRRPSNAGMAGIVGLARMTDKARAHQAERIGQFKYGADSGLDQEVLEFIGMTAEEFAQTAVEHHDEALAERVLRQAGKSREAIEAFNREHCERQPQDELHRQLLAERLARYAPGRTDIHTVFASIELDDWGAFRQVDLTGRPPRTPYLRTVGGMVGAARMADKARAFKTGKLGEYRYGKESGIDARILEFLQLDEAEFAEAAYRNPNDLELSEWLQAQRPRTAAENCAFNARLTSHGKRGPSRAHFLERRGKSYPDGPALDCWFALLDYDDEHSFGLVDLTRHAPRSPYDGQVGGVSGLARMIDKGRALLGDTLGEYWYGGDSGIDRMMLEFLGVTADEFTAALQQCATDDALVDWLNKPLAKSAAQLEAFHRKARTAGPDSEQKWAFLRQEVARLDAQRHDITCWYALMELDDQVSFARLQAGV